MRGEVATSRRTGDRPSDDSTPTIDASSHNIPMSTADELRAEADAMLGAGLRAVLANYGEVHVLGSYALGLMTWRDLDIHLVQQSLELTRHFELGARLAELLGAAKMNFRDNRAAGDPNLPPGLYWGVYLGDERRGAWKLDVWGLERAAFEPRLAELERLRNRLSPTARERILDIKSAVWSHPEYRRAFTSRDIYTAVLEHDVRDVAAFWEYLGTSNAPR